jgi:hypothetical protein
MPLTKVQIGMTDAPTSGTAVTASGTSIDFTGIPATAKRITVMFSGVSTNGTSNYLIQLGDAGGVETTGYSSRATSTSAQANTTAGFIITQSQAAADLVSGNIVICTLGSNVWVSGGNISNIGQNAILMSAGTKTLSDTLTQVRITTVNGTDTFDAGTINIMWE